VNTVPVTVDNFTRAESDLYMGNIVKDGGLGKFIHRREPASIDNQTVIRLNRDTLYSAAVFDLDAAPVTIALPDAGKRFMSLQVINEDHYVPEVAYGAGAYTLSRNKVGTRYAAVAVRTLVDPTDAKDAEQVHALQDAIKASQDSSKNVSRTKMIHTHTYYTLYLLYNNHYSIEIITFFLYSVSTKFTIRFDQPLAQRSPPSSQLATRAR
jgi:hypothetical protein